MSNITSEYGFTIIVPLYNEEDNMARLESSLASFLEHSIRKACVLFVNDGSRDGTLAGLRDICSRNSDFHYISFSEN